jgi:hypothetical protein
MDEHPAGTCHHQPFIGRPTMTDKSPTTNPTDSSNVVPLFADEPKLPDILSLPFVADFPVLEKGKKRRSTFRCFWNVTRTGDYRADCVAGECLALEYLRWSKANYEASFCCGAILGWIASDMPPKHTGLEVGFFSIVGAAAAAGAAYGERLSEYWADASREQ